MIFLCSCLFLVQAFLACVGYKVFYYALKFCDFDPRQFFTAAFIGIALYFCKVLPSSAKHA